MGYQIIRCAVDRSLVIVVSPENARPNNPNNEYYRYATWSIGKSPINKFHVISADEALAYFGGQADGLGHGKFPTRAFERLRDVVKWIDSDESEIIADENDQWTHHPVNTAPTNRRVLVFGDTPNDMAMAWKSQADELWRYYVPQAEGSLIPFEIKQWCRVPEPGDK